MDGLSDRGLADAAGVESHLELEQRVLRAAQAAAEMEPREPTLLCPARRFVEDEVRGRGRAGALVGRAQVVVQPRLRREAECDRDELAVEDGVEADEALAERGQAAAVPGREAAALSGMLAPHRLGGERV